MGVGGARTLCIRKMKLSLHRGKAARGFLSCLKTLLVVVVGWRGWACELYIFARGRLFIAQLLLLLCYYVSRKRK